MSTSGAGPGRPVDRRVRRTQATLQNALIELVAEQDLTKITVADVAERAEVSRSTFYDHYRDVHELAEAACTAMIDDLIDSLPQTQYAAEELERSATDGLRQFFASLAEHANLYRSLLGPHGSARIIDHIRRRVTARLYAGEAEQAGQPESPLDVPTAFIAGALIGVAVDWLQHDRPHPPADMAARTWPLFAALVAVLA
ncbi:TetR/AcrR family transcriptional regulator [Amycolatopsis suaedae]|uniref:TetR/AcrR family transcriptional regulator n=1 Tax=Amycolatopsis suaedae TaxID=2510978 RepID=A0A4Q7J206_9PSEU|nr:TetR/AcrR family transcriptional regulator [Amycolatopsis suaedae]RZQ61460.1 TetR/AcrR family transcriptional regulator [Amycolatopsis suaedae]